MAELRPIASLTANLLARKGAARPAMRPQLDLAPVHAPDRGAPRHAPSEDLGWNDFGAHETAPEAAAPVPVPAPAPAPAAETVSLSIVRRQQQAIAERIGAESEESAPSRRSALEQGRRAAFTLRLDAERHLALRLAATITGRSAQQVVTEALDRLLAEKPEVAALAAQIQQPVHAPNSLRGNEK